MNTDLFSDNVALEIPNPNVVLLPDEIYDHNVRTLKEFTIGDKLIIEDPDAPRNNACFGILKNFELNDNREIILVVDVIGFMLPWRIHPANKLVELTRII